jgi:hypothetical protein
MLREEVAHGLPALSAHLNAVVAHLERVSDHSNKKVSRRIVLDAFLQTRSYTETARRCGITDSAVQNIVGRAIRTARGIAGLPRPTIKPSPIILKRGREARAVEATRDRTQEHRPDDSRGTRSTPGRV